MTLAIVASIAPAEADPPLPKETTPSETAQPAPTKPAAPAPAGAQSPNASAKRSSDLPSADILKKARNGGYYTKVVHNEVYYCKKQADLGSRFTKETCLNENQLEQTLIFQQAQRDQMSNHACSGGGCAGK